MPAPPARSAPALLRRAGRGDEQAVREVVAVHGPQCWRLAWAVLGQHELAAASVADGVARAAAVRRGADTPVHTLVLAGTYAAAVARSRASAAPDVPGAAGGGASEPSAAVALAGLRSLPERWRAAAWLHEVEQVEPATVATVLDTSPAVALQLTIRARRSLLARFSQIGETAPADLSGVLRAQAPAPPAGLADAAVARCRSVRGRRLPGFGRGEALVRPLGVAAGAVAALGVIGIGVVDGRAGSTQGIEVRTASAPGADAAGLLGTPAARSLAELRALLAGLPFTVSQAALSPGSAAALAPAAGGGPAAGGAPGQTAPGSGGGSGAAPGQGAPGPGGVTPPPVDVGPVAVGPVGVTPGGGGTTVSVGGVIGATVGPCTSVDLAGLTVPVTCGGGTSGGSANPSPTTTAAPLVTTPSVSTPVATVPSVSVTLPGGGLPAVTLPTGAPVTTPTVTLPPVTIPPVTLPPVTLPPVTLPLVTPGPLSPVLPTVTTLPLGLGGL